MDLVIQLKVNQGRYFLRVHLSLCNLSRCSRVRKSLSRSKKVVRVNAQALNHPRAQLKRSPLRNVLKLLRATGAGALFNKILLISKKRNLEKPLQIIQTYKLQNRRLMTKPPGMTSRFAWAKYRTTKRVSWQMRPTTVSKLSRSSSNYSSRLNAHQIAISSTTSS